MQIAAIDRIQTGPHGTFGKLTTLGFSMFTCEPPWKDNRSDVSCIPTGEYICTWHQSPRFGGVYLVNDVPGRAFILTHRGNIGGDIEQGLLTHTHGCILGGKYFGVVRGQRAVCLSRPTMTRFFNHMQRKDFRLVVRGEFNV